MTRVHPTQNQGQAAPQQSNYEWLKSQIPTNPSDVVSFVKSAAEKAVIDLGVMSAAFDSSSDSADRFTYAMYGAGAVYMVCDILEKYPQMKSLGGQYQDFKSEFWKDTKETISNSTFAAVGAIGAAIISQTATDKAESTDAYKQIPIAVLTGVGSFLYLQSSRAIEEVSAEKRAQLHEREVAEPFEQGITDAISILSGSQSQQSRADIVQELENAAQDKILQFDKIALNLSNATQEINGLKRTIAAKDDIISELTREKAELNKDIKSLTQEKTELSNGVKSLAQRNDQLDTENQKLNSELERFKESTEMAQEDTLSWAQRVKEGSIEPNQSREG